jgi:hypothetical protein
MQRLIRKISVGPNYKEAMHYIVGAQCLRESYIISDIKNTSAGVYEIWISNEDEEFQLWKEISGMPVSIEYHVEV